MNNDKNKSGVLLTSEGLKSLKKELDELKIEKLPAVMERVAKAREDGDLSENSAYQFGKQEQEFLNGRIEELEEILKNATLISKDTDSATGKIKSIGIGCKVTVSVGGKSHIFSVVGDWEANPAEKKISGSSPLGGALMGKKIGDKAEVDAPAGKIVYTVVEIE